MPHHRPQKCVACNTPTGGAWLCARCQALVSQHAADNPRLLAAYVAAGLAEADVCLATHALFDDYINKKEATMGYVKVKTADGRVLAGVRDPEDENVVTVFPGFRKDDEDLQGPAVPVKVGEGTPYEIVEG